jgi:hypothetical protein
MTKGADELLSWLAMMPMARLTRALLLAGVLGGTGAGCSKDPGTPSTDPPDAVEAGTPEAASATTARGATTTASATPSTAPSANAAATSTATAMATSSADGGAKATTCGDKPLPPCPLGGWMKANTAAAMSAQDFDALGVALTQVVGFAPPGYANWASIARDGASAAQAQSLDGVKASCRGCHRQYKDKYKKEMRDRPI